MLPNTPFGKFTASDCMFSVSDYPFGMPTASDYLFGIFIASDYPFGIFKASDYPFSIFYCF